MQKPLDALVAKDGRRGRFAFRDLESTSLQRHFARNVGDNGRSSLAASNDFDRHILEIDVPGVSHVEEMRRHRASENASTRVVRLALLQIGFLPVCCRRQRLHEERRVAYGDVGDVEPWNAAYEIAYAAKGRGRHFYPLKQDSSHGGPRPVLAAIASPQPEGNRHANAVAHDDVADTHVFKYAPVHRKEDKPSSAVLRIDKPRPTRSAYIPPPETRRPRDNLAVVDVKLAQNAMRLCAEFYVTCIGRHAAVPYLYLFRHPIRVEVLHDDRVVFGNDVAVLYQCV